MYSRERLQGFVRHPAPVLLALLLLATSGCGSLTPVENVAVGTVGLTALGARTPAQEIEQIYYLGVFDPQEQVPPMVYRVRVHGQASILSGVNFGSGWVPAQIIDSLNSNISYNQGAIQIDKGAGETLAALQTGRRLVMFGPEGFREAPADHRLVIVMGASPEKFFNAIDRSLGAVNDTIVARRNENLNKLLLQALSEANRERQRLDDLKKDIANDFASN